MSPKSGRKEVQVRPVVGEEAAYLDSGVPGLQVSQQSL